MILLKPTPRTQEMRCEAFKAAFELDAPDTIGGQHRLCSAEWKGDRLFLHYDWVSERIEAIAFIRLQVFPFEGEVWIGAIEVHPSYRNQEIGSQLVRAVETAALHQGAGMVRLFSRMKATGFWTKLGYSREADPRYYCKSVPEQRSPR